jgi:tetratricopeptide (TPR) repeat protein
VEDLRPVPAHSSAPADQPPPGVEVSRIERGPEFVPEPTENVEIETIEIETVEVETIEIEPGTLTGSGTSAPETPSFEATDTRNASPAVATLLESAGRHADAGELDKAAAALERALRIDPRNASVWHDLGEVRYYQTEYQQAEALAKRSNSLAGGDSELRVNNWGLIERSRRARGDQAGADAASAQAKNL